VGVNDTPHLTP